MVTVAFFRRSGDSSVIRDNNPYREQRVTVEKIECANHLLRNLCKKLKAVAETVQPKTQIQRGFVQSQNVVKSNILNFRKVMVKAAEQRRKKQTSQHIKVVELQEDISNIPSHIFGEHKQCEARGRQCKKNGDKMEKNHVPSLKSFGLYQKIESAITYISTKAYSLLLNYTNNPAESFNSIICKEIGGKRISFGKRGSYNARVAGALCNTIRNKYLHNCMKACVKLFHLLLKIWNIADKSKLQELENLEKHRENKDSPNKSQERIVIMVPNRKNRIFRQRYLINSDTSILKSYPKMRLTGSKLKLKRESNVRIMVIVETRNVDSVSFWNRVSHETDNVLRNDSKSRFVFFIH
ncbi:uncharacterized protein LOC143895049 [Temnothorax americanus]|uniref:uncharacterized protein LOC143895049 n=1 Tax=Temnothorax americanus TaxID=1964332 RepID=UPI0040679785